MRIKAKKTRKKVAAPADALAPVVLAAAGALPAHPGKSHKPKKAKHSASLDAPGKAGAVDEWRLETAAELSVKPKTKRATKSKRQAPQAKRKLRVSTDLAAAKAIPATSKRSALTKKRAAKPAGDALAPLARARVPRKIATAAQAARAVGAQAPLLQVAALPVNTRAGDRRVLLVTSRETQRWIVPKGWPMKGRKLWEAAALEAKQEAGVVGLTGKKPVGSYTYFKRRDGHSDFCEVQVFALEVDRQVKQWREKGERRLAWMNPDEAADAVDDPGLADLIRIWGSATPEFS